MLNRAPATGRLKATVLAGLAVRKVPVLEPSFGNRTAFAASFLDGLAVTETAPRSVAADEARALALAIARRARGG
jgi:chromosome partitioning protein